jgi:hypothetical protein
LQNIRVPSAGTQILPGGWFNGLAGCGANYSNLHQKRNKRMKKRESLLTFLVP